MITLNTLLSITWDGSNSARLLQFGFWRETAMSGKRLPLLATYVVALINWKKLCLDWLNPQDCPAIVLFYEALFTVCTCTYLTKIESPESTGLRTDVVRMTQWMQTYLLNFINLCETRDCMMTRWHRHDWWWMCQNFENLVREKRKSSEFAEQIQHHSHHETHVLRTEVHYSK